MHLKLIRIVKKEHGVRSFKDRRTRVTRITAEYKDEEGKVYRKSFESGKGYPTAPSEGSHNLINSYKFQKGEENENA